MNEFFQKIDKQRSAAGMGMMNYGLTNDLQNRSEERPVCVVPSSFDHSEWEDFGTSTPSRMAPAGREVADLRSMNEIAIEEAGADVGTDELAVEARELQSFQKAVRQNTETTEVSGAKAPVWGHIDNSAHVVPISQQIGRSYPSLPSGNAETGDVRRNFADPVSRIAVSQNAYSALSH